MPFFAARRSGAHRRRSVVGEPDDVDPPGVFRFLYPAAASFLFIFSSWRTRIPSITSGSVQKILPNHATDPRQRRQAGSPAHYATRINALCGPGTERSAETTFGGQAWPLQGHGGGSFGCTSTIINEIRAVNNITVSYNSPCAFGTAPRESEGPSSDRPRLVTGNLSRNSSVPPFLR